MVRGAGCEVTCGDGYIGSSQELWCFGANIPNGGWGGTYPDCQPERRLGQDRIIAGRVFVTFELSCPPERNLTESPGDLAEGLGAKVLAELQACNSAPNFSLVVPGLQVTSMVLEPYEPPPTSTTSSTSLTTTETRTTTTTTKRYELQTIRGDVSFSLQDEPPQSFKDAWLNDEQLKDDIKQNLFAQLAPAGVAWEEFETYHRIEEGPPTSAGRRLQQTTTLFKVDYTIRQVLDFVNPTAAPTADAGTANSSEVTTFSGGVWLNDNVTLSLPSLVSNIASVIPQVMSNYGLSNARLKDFIVADTLVDGTMQDSLSTSTETITSTTSGAIPWPEAKPASSKVAMAVFGAIFAACSVFLLVLVVCRLKVCPPKLDPGPEEEKVTFWEYRPQNGLPAIARLAPEIDGARGRFVLKTGDVFRVVEERKAADGVTYLRLGDNKGWLFDRTAEDGVLCIRHNAMTAQTYENLFHDIPMEGVPLEGVLLEEPGARIPADRDASPNSVHSVDNFTEQPQFKQGYWQYSCC